MIEWWGPIVHEYYAGTEGNGFCYVGSEDWLSHKGTVGQAARSARCTSSTTTATSCRPVRPARSTSRAAASSSTTTTRRRRRRRATPQGWSTLGDVGYLDDDGFLYLTDRKAFMIISGGVNIYPQEAENVLVIHPKVVDVAVFGVPNDDFGEEVKAVVQPVDLADGRARAGAGADRVLPQPAGRREVPPLDRLPRRAAPPPDRQALQAAAEGRVLGGPRPQPHHLTGQAHRRGWRRRLARPAPPRRPGCADRGRRRASHRARRPARRPRSRRGRRASRSTSGPAIAPT